VIRAGEPGSALARSGLVEARFDHVIAADPLFL
jgi:hypothetical protein